MKRNLNKDARKKGRATKKHALRRDKILIACEFGQLPLELDELESEKIKFCRNPRDWRCGCGS